MADVAVFDRSGVRFRYPANWDLDLDDAGGGWTVTVLSPATAFVLVSLRPDLDDPDAAAGEALDALTAEYPELDAAPAAGTLVGLPAVGHDIDFLTLDTPVVCWTRAAATPVGVLLVLCQVSEHDRAAHEVVLKAIAASVDVAE